MAFGAFCHAVHIIYVSQFLMLSCILYVTALEAYWYTEASAALLLSFLYLYSLGLRFFYCLGLLLACKRRKIHKVQHTLYNFSCNWLHATSCTQLVAQCMLPKMVACNRLQLVARNRNSFYSMQLVAWKL